MTTVGTFMTISSAITWVVMLWILVRILRDEFFRKLLILKGHRKMLIWVLILSALMFVLAFLGGKFA